MIVKRVLISTAVICLSLGLSSQAQFSDDFESGLSNWEVSYWTGATFVEDPNGNPGKAGHYEIGTNSGWIQVVPDAWEAAELDDSDYRFEADFRFASNDMSCLIAGRANDLWVLDYYGVAFKSALQAAWEITIYGPYENPGPTFTPDSAPEGLVLNVDGSWNHVELTLQGTRMEVEVNGTLLYAGNGHPSRSMAGRLAVRTGWLGDFYIDNVLVEDVPWPITCEGIQQAGYGLQADVTQDCYVDIADFAALSGGWMECNDPEDPNNCLSNWQQ